MSNLPKKISFIVFSAMLVILPIITILSPKHEFSDDENRYLEKLPSFSFQKVMNKRYMQGIESYVSDHFIGRTSWISYKTDIELLMGKHESNGIYILKDRLLEKLNPPDYDEIDKSITAINNFQKNNNIPTYFMIAPTAIGIYSEELPKNAPDYDEKLFINDIYKKLSPDITSLDAYSALSSNRDEYIYYRNDHHWTSLGAYYAYAATIKKMGFTAVSRNKFDIEHASSTFKGTLYSKSLYDKVEADTLDLYHYDDGVKVTEVDVNTGKETKTYNSMYFKDYLNKKDKYSTFLGSNQPVVTIKTDSQKGGKLLIFKDSYAHCFVPFLVQHYSEITMVDMRYINSAYDEVVNVGDFDQALFLYNAETFATESNIKKLDLK